MGNPLLGSLKLSTAIIYFFSCLGTFNSVVLFSLSPHCGLNTALSLSASSCQSRNFLLRVTAFQKFFLWKKHLPELILFFFYAWDRGFSCSCYPLDRFLLSDLTRPKERGVVNNLNQIYLRLTLAFLMVLLHIVLHVLLQNSASQETFPTTQGTMPAATDVIRAIQGIIFLKASTHAHGGEIRYIELHKKKNQWLLDAALLLEAQNSKTIETHFHTADREEETNERNKFRT